MLGDKGMRSAVATKASFLVFKGFLHAYSPLSPKGIFSPLTVTDALTTAN